MQEALERAVAELVLGPEIAGSDRAAIAAWAQRHRLAAEDAEYFLDHGLSGLLVYRGLGRETLREAVACSMPRLMARLGGLFDEWFARFLTERGPRSHALREVARELLDWCEPRWAADPRVPAWASDLGRFESLAIEIGSAPDSARVVPGALELECGVRFIRALRLVRYRFAVHQLPEALDDRTVPAERPSWLLVYRSPEHEVRTLELSPLAAAILGRLLGQRLALGAAVRSACAELAQPLDAAVLQGTARLLADLAERGVLLGAEQEAATGGARAWRRLFA